MGFDFFGLRKGRDMANQIAAQGRESAGRIMGETEAATKRLEGLQGTIDSDEATQYGVAGRDVMNAAPGIGGDSQVNDKALIANALMSNAVTRSANTAKRKTNLVNDINAVRGQGFANAEEALTQSQRDSMMARPKVTPWDVTRGVVSGFAALKGMGGGKG